MILRRIDAMVRRRLGTVAVTEQRRPSNVALGLPDRVYWVDGVVLFWEGKRTENPAPTTGEQRAWFHRTWEHRGVAGIGDDLAFADYLERILPLVRAGKNVQAYALAQETSRWWLDVKPRKPKPAKAPRKASPRRGADDRESPPPA